MDRNYWTEPLGEEELVLTVTFLFATECDLKSVVCTYLGYKRGTLEIIGLTNCPHVHVHSFHDNPNRQGKKRVRGK